jgi:plasmid stability protein
MKDKIMFAFLLPSEMLKELRRRAKSEDVSVSDIVRHIIKDALAKKGEKNGKV